MPESATSELLEEDSPDAHDPITTTSLGSGNSTKSLTLEPLSPLQETSMATAAKESPRQSLYIFSPS